VGHFYFGTVGQYYFGANITPPEVRVCAEAAIADGSIGHTARQRTPRPCYRG